MSAARRGKRSRQAREQRAITAALHASPSVGVRPERIGRFFPNHDHEEFALDAPVPDEPPADPYWTGSGLYREVCERCAFPGQHPDCRTCHGLYEVRTLIGGKL